MFTKCWVEKYKNSLNSLKECINLTDYLTVTMLWAVVA